CARPWAPPCSGGCWREKFIATPKSSSSCWITAEPENGGANVAHSRGDLREHHSRSQWAIDGDLGFRTAHESADRQRHTFGGRGPPVRQRSAENDHPAGN